MFSRLTTHMLRQAEVNDMHLQMANGRVPPSWGPESERSYSFRNYETDAMLWTYASDMDDGRKGPALALRLTGAAKMIVRELDPQMLVQGQIVVENGANVQLTGVQFLMRILRRRYAPLEQELQLHAVSEFFSFVRLPQEDTDQVVARFEVLSFRARDIGGAAVNEVVLAWMLLHHLRIPKDRWPLILLDTRGMLPNDPAQYQAFLLYLRRNGHLYDRGNDHAKNVSGSHYFVDPYTSNAPETASMFPMFESQDAMPFESYEGFQTYPSFDQETISSGNSNSHSEIDLSDLTGLTFAQAAEVVYAGFRTHKRRWRKFAGPRRSKGKGKGKFGKKGKVGKFSPPAFRPPRPTYFGEDYCTESEWPTSAESSYTFPEVDQSSIYAVGGKGKGKRRGNPIGRDGKQMLCSGCNSPEHFVKDCPTTPGKGKGKSSSFFTADTWESPIPPTSSAASSQQNMPARGIYMSIHEEVPQPAIEPELCTITFADGSPSVCFDSTRARSYMIDDGNSLMPAMPRQAFFPWWKTELNEQSSSLSTETQVPCYHSSVRLKDDREGVVLDTGAVFSLSGDQWVNRSKEIGEKFGHGSSVTQLDRPFGIEGVGQGSNKVQQSAVIPIALQHGIIGTFTTNVVNQSPIPALCGLNPMISQRTILDLVNGKMILLGEGGYNLNLSPGSVVLDLERAATGHLILPTSEWSKAKQTGKKGIALLAL